MNKADFYRTELLVGQQGMQKLARTCVAIIGLGGVGSYSAEALARSGIGKFILIDFDVIEATNINRQILALHSTIGKPKVEIMQQRILDINPQAEVIIYKEFLDKENAEVNSTMTSIEIERFGEKKEVVSRGDVNLVSNESTVHGEYATYFEESEKMYVEGNPSLKQENKTVYCGRIIIYPNSDKIILTDGLNVNKK